MRVYQAVLGKAWDNSVTIVAVGHLTVILELLEAPGGKELVASKVKHMIVMGGTLYDRPVPEWVSGTPYCTHLRSACSALIQCLLRAFEGVKMGLNLGRHDRVAVSRPTICDDSVW